MAGYGAVVQITQGPPDGRDVAFANQLVNASVADEIQLDSIELIDPDGLTFVEAFTFDIDKEVGNVWVPLLPDPRGDAVSNAEMVAHWETRVLLSDTVLEPQDVRWISVQVHPESDRTCVWAKGYRISYHENGRKFTVDANFGIAAFFGDPDDDLCEEAADYILENPLPGR